MIPNEQIQNYLAKSGDDELATGKKAVHPEHGFCIYDCNNEALVLIQVYGNGEFWDQWAEIKAQELGVNKIMFATKRSPKAYCRKYGYKIVGHVLEREL